ncbi:MAG: TIGR03960 family B12-binding radical SAM protein [Desulfovibrionaceae bacterium]|nr:TIGR03960 family B12-binding radical SAM protein [Desulfovibrionaceae bacterium]
MRELLPLLPKPSRYLGIEEGSVHKPFAEIRLKVGLAFPDMYEVGMSYLGQKILYSIINERESWLAERVFTPCREAGAVLRERGTPLCTLESDTPLAQLDVLGFSLTHELCYSNVLYMLDLAGIPLRADQRKTPQPDGRPWPLIVAGGGCTLAAEPLAPFVDVMILGEAESLMPEVLEAVQAAREQGFARADLLLSLSRIPGVYVPEFFSENPDGSLTPLYAHHAKITRRIVPDMNAAPYPVRQPIPFGAVHNRLALEIGRGCTRGCRFCQAGSLYRPARERDTAELRTLLESCLSGTGFDDVSFLSLSTGDFSALKELFMSTVDRCAREQVSVSLPSLRVGSIDDAIMERMAGIRRTGATLAPEAGSQRLRDVINKGITEQDVVLHVQKLFEHGWQQVKLYFMIGLPTETDEDLLAIIDLCRKARDAAGPGIKRLQITAAISPFVPKPHTPFQWEAQISLEEIRRRVGILLDAVKKEKRIKLRWHEPEMSALEGLFSRGDRKLADVVESAYRKGAVFTSWIEGFSLDPWLEALAEHGLAMPDYIRERGLDEPLPWDHLESGLSKEFFARERERAQGGKTSSDCRYTACHACGVCDTKAAPSRLDRLPGLPDAFTYRNRLNKPHRDQEAHSVSLDQYGRVIVRGQTEDAPKPQGKAKPPALAPHLVKKAAQLRIRYMRKGRAAYLSQLEVQHIFDRALRRADMPLTFSQGFHPLPLLSFGRALPVGVASENEWFSLYLREPRPLKESLEALNASLPKGLRVTSIEALPLDKKSADEQTERFVLRYIGPEADRPAFARAWRDIAEAPALPWKKESKKGARDLDARPFFMNILYTDVDTCTLDIDWSKGYVSPLALCLHALESVNFPAALPHLLLTKVAPEDCQA